MIPYVCQILNQMMNESLKKKILVCLLIPLGWIYMSVLMLKSDESQVKEVFINEGRGNSPSHLKFFLLVFSKLKEDIK